MLQFFFFLKRMAFFYYQTPVKSKDEELTDVGRWGKKILERNTVVLLIPGPVSWILNHFPFSQESRI